VQEARFAQLFQEAEETLDVALPGIGIPNAISGAIPSAISGAFNKVQLAWVGVNDPWG
jgi:hypothetical protein